MSVQIIGDIDSLMKTPTPRLEGSTCGVDLAAVSMDVARSLIDAILDQAASRGYLTRTARPH
jgi:hypothetical protein